MLNKLHKNAVHVLLLGNKELDGRLGRQRK